MTARSTGSKQGDRNGFATEERPIASGVTVADGDFVKLVAGGTVTTAGMSTGELYGVAQGAGSENITARSYKNKSVGDANGINTALVELVDGMRYEVPVNGSLAADAIGQYYKLLDVSSVLLTSTGTAPANNDTVTIGGVVYTFKTTLTGAANEVLIGASAAAALDNLKAAVNDTGGTEGTDYGTGTVANPLVAATTNTNTTQLFTAINAATDGAELPALESSAQLSFSTPTFMGGPARQAVDNATKSATVGQLVCRQRVATNAAGTEFKKGIFEVASLVSDTTVS